MPFGITFAVFTGCPNFQDYGIPLQFGPTVGYFHLGYGNVWFMIHGDELVINLQEHGVVLHFGSASGNIEWDLNHGAVQIAVQGFLSVLPLLNGNNVGLFWTFCIQNN